MVPLSPVTWPASCFSNTWRRVSSPFLNCERPVILFMDNAKTHISLDVVEFCAKEKILPVMLPANITQLLQPADRVFRPLKKKMSDLLHTAGLLRPDSVSGQAKFPARLRYAMPAVSLELVKTAWRHTGLHPLDAQAVDAGKLVVDTLAGPQGAQECPPMAKSLGLHSL